MNGRTLTTAALCLSLLATATSASADIVYTCCSLGVSHSGFTEVATGSITTDGSIGELQPENILSWDLTISQFFNNTFQFAVSFSPDAGGTLS
jgi:hypothetical protein